MSACHPTPQECSFCKNKFDACSDCTDGYCSNECRHKQRQKQAAAALDQLEAAEKQELKLALEALPKSHNRDDRRKYLKTLRPPRRATAAAALRKAVEMQGAFARIKPSFPLTPNSMNPDDQATPVAAEDTQPEAPAENAAPVGAPAETETPAEAPTEPTAESEETEPAQPADEDSEPDAPADEDESEEEPEDGEGEPKCTQAEA